MYRICHNVFNDFDFQNGEDALRVAERFAEFAVRKDPDLREIHIDIIKLMQPAESGETEPGWFHWKDVNCRIGSNLREYYD